MPAHGQLAGSQRVPEKVSVGKTYTETPARLPGSRGGASQCTAGATLSSPAPTAGASPLSLWWRNTQNLSGTLW